MCEKRTSYWWRLWHLMRLFYSVNLDFWFRTRVRRWTWADIGPIRAWYCSHAQFHKDYAEWWSKGNDQLEHRPRRKYPRNLRHLAIGREITFLFKTKHLNHLNWRRKIICCEKSENLEILWAKTSRFHVFWKTLSQIAFRASFVPVWVVEVPYGIWSGKREDSVRETFGPFGTFGWRPWKRFAHRRLISYPGLMTDIYALCREWDVFRLIFKISCCRIGVNSPLIIWFFILFLRPWQWNWKGGFSGLVGIRVAIWKYNGSAFSQLMGWLYLFCV